MFNEYLISTLTMITLGMNELNSLPLGCINLHTSSCSRSETQVAVNRVAGAKGNKQIYLHVRVGISYSVKQICKTWVF